MRNGRCNQIGKTWLHHPWLVVREKKSNNNINICTGFGNSYHDNCEDDNTTSGLATSWQFWGKQFNVIPITQSYRHIFVSYFCFDYFLPLHKIWSQSQMYPLELSWAPKARSKILRTPQNVPVWTLSCPTFLPARPCRPQDDFGLVMIKTISSSTDELSEKMEAWGKLGSFLLALFTRTDYNARNFNKKNQ